MARFKGRLTKMKSDHNRLRTDTVEGVFDDLPTEGSPFALVGESLTPGLDARLFLSSDIQMMLEEGERHRIFRTYNSTYRLDFIETHPPRPHDATE